MRLEEHYVEVRKRRRGGVTTNMAAEPVAGGAGWPVPRAACVVRSLPSCLSTNAL